MKALGENLPHDYWRLHKEVPNVKVHSISVERVGKFHTSYLKLSDFYQIRKVFFIFEYLTLRNVDFTFNIIAAK